MCVFYGCFRAVNPNEVPNIGLHSSMFRFSVQTQMSSEQKRKWMPMVQNYEIIGTYAQTELGHGEHCCLSVSYHACDWLIT